MKAISLLQPWATLAVIGAKKIETRSRSTHYRGDILIHASLGKAGEIFANELPFKKYIPDFNVLPFGAFIGKATITKVIRTEDFFLSDHEMNLLTMEEKAFGNYNSGRYGYLLENPVIFERPIAAKGQLTIPWEIKFEGSDESEIIQCSNCGLAACLDHFISHHSRDIQRCPVCKRTDLHLLF